MSPGESQVVPLLRPAVFFARSAVNRFLVLAVVWGAAVVVSPIAIAGLSGEYFTTSPGASLAVPLSAIELLALFATVGLSFATIRTWAGTVRTLDRGLHSNEEWQRAVLAPLHRRFRMLAVSSVALVGLFLFALVDFFRISMQLTGTGLPAFSDTWPIAAASAAAAPLLVATLLTAVGSLAFPVHGSEVPDIEQSLAASRRVAGWTVPFGSLPGLVFALALFLLSTAPWLWLASWAGVVAPVGLVLALNKARVAYERWTDLASRVF